MDIVYVLDASGSVSSSDFSLMRQFAADVATVMDVNGDNVRIADIVYSSSAVVHFDFDDHTTTSAVRTDLLATPKSKC
jgi:hypothetical protein